MSEGTKARKHVKNEGKYARRHAAIWGTKTRKLKLKTENVNIAKIENVTKESYFKVFAFMKSIDENRLFYEFTYTKWDLIQWTVSCFTVFITVILIKMILKLGTLPFWTRLA